MDAKYYQHLLLERSKKIYPSLSNEVVDAFLKTPRHLYVPIYRNAWDTKWIHVDSRNLEENLSALYSDNPLCIYSGPKHLRSTISQPSFVLKMIDMLDLKPGHKVFELGLGSGWNAALISRIVGPIGKVIGLEIIPELVERATKSLHENQISNVVAINADAGDGWALEAPYDRAIFTAGAEDLPRCFFEQIKNGGLLLFVFKNKSGGDQLFLLKKIEDHFKSLHSMSCSFVPVTGKYAAKQQSSTPLNKILKDYQIPDKIVHEKNFSWSEIKRIDSFQEIEALKFFFDISLQEIVLIEMDDDQTACGFLDKESHSLAVIHEDKILSYGNTEALQHFMSSLKNWVNVGMPEIEGLELQIYPAKTIITPKTGQWIVHHHDSIFVWQAPNHHISTQDEMEKVMT